MGCSRNVRIDALAKFPGILVPTTQRLEPFMPGLKKIDAISADTKVKIINDYVNVNCSIKELLSRYNLGNYRYLMDILEENFIEVRSRSERTKKLFDTRKIRGIKIPGVDFTPGPNETKISSLSESEKESIVSDYTSGDLTVKEIIDYYNLGNHRYLVKILFDAGIDFKDARSRKFLYHTKISSRGYIQEKIDTADPLYCMAQPSTGYAAQHRLVMARHLGRPLSKKETVHHIDGDRYNNIIENLQLRTGHHGQGVKLVCRQCGSSDIQPKTL